MEQTIIIADDEPITRMDLREILTDSGYKVVGEASDGFDAIELCKTKKPDLVLLDIKMPLLDGLRAARIIYEEQLAKGILIITAYSTKECVDRAKQAGVLGYVVKPIKVESLLPMVEIALEKGREISNLQQQMQKTQQRLDDRILIEKAKGVLMKEKQIGEKKAFELIRKIGMDKRRPMKDIAEIILLNESQEPS